MIEREEMVIEAVKSFYRDKNVLVTGGAGFIGSHIVERLVAYGAHVTILDNFSTGALKNIASVLNQVTVCYADISNEFSLLKATKNKDVVFHLAALVSVAQSVKQPKLCERINTQGTRNVLEAAVAHKVTSLVFSSSSAVYGNQEGVCSEDSPTNPLSPYAHSKLQGELLCKKVAHEHSINTACLRYFNVYGNRQNPQGEYAAVVAKFNYALTNQQPIVIFGDGHQTRDFIHVHDVVDANLIVGSQTHLRGDVFNVGTGKSISLLELLTNLEEKLHTKAVGTSFQPTREGDVKYSQANCEKIQHLTRSFTL